MITPTPGRIVHYRPGPGDVANHSIGEPLAAIVCHVWNDRMVNLCVFDANGNPMPRTSVVLLQPGDQAPTGGAYCEWMQYQLGQAERARAAEERAIT